MLPLLPWRLTVRWLVRRPIEGVGDGRKLRGCATRSKCARCSCLLSPCVGLAGFVRMLGDGVDVAVAEPIALLEGEDVGVVNDPVDHRGGDGLVAEHTAPAGERQVRGEDQ